MNLAVVGATGQVGAMMLRMLDERKFAYTRLHLYASPASAGRTLVHGGIPYTLQDPDGPLPDDLDLALFSAGAQASRRYAPRFAAAGAVVIDNSSAWRTNDQVPLVVSEVNPQRAREAPLGIIANPNCTTMVAMPVLYPLHTHAKLTALTVTTFQAVSGAGRAGTVELESELRTLLDGDFSNLITQTRNDEPAPGALFPAMVACNVVPQAGDMLLDGSGATVEERKLEFESRKILEIPALDVDVTCVRVPVVTGHSLSLVATFARPVSTSQATAILASAPGVAHDDLPTPLKATGRDVTLVGRIRQSAQDPCRLSLFVSGDNLRKGAALNAVQIAEYLRLG